MRRRRPASARLLKVYSKRVCDQARAFLEMLRARCDCVLVCMCLRACVLCGERTLNPKAIELGGQGWVFDTSRRARGFRRGPVKQDREGPSVPKRLSLDTLNPKLQASALQTARSRRPSDPSELPYTDRDRRRRPKGSEEEFHSYMRIHIVLY